MVFFHGKLSTASKPVFVHLRCSDLWQELWNHRLYRQSTYLKVKSGLSSLCCITLMTVVWFLNDSYPCSSCWTVSQNLVQTYPGNGAVAKLHYTCTFRCTSIMFLISSHLGLDIHLLSLSLCYNFKAHGAGTTFIICKNLNQILWCGLVSKNTF